MYKRLLISPLGLVAVLCGLALPSALQAQVMAGYNCFDTAGGTTYAGTSWLGVPLGTFDFGSGPLNVGQTDTIIQRMGPAVTTPGGTMPLQVDALQLVTATPVSIGGGPIGYYYATLNTGFANTGVLTVDSFPNGTDDGTFNDFFMVNVDIRFGALNGPIVAPAGVPGVTQLILDAAGQWLPSLPIPAPPVVHQDNQSAGDFHIVRGDISDPALAEANGFFAIPEPSAFALLGLGALCLALKTRQGRK